MSIICKDIITNLKYLSQNVMKLVDSIKLTVANNSSTAHLYFVALQCTGPGSVVLGAASGAQQPCPSAGPSADATPWSPVGRWASRQAGLLHSSTAARFHF